MPFYTVETDTLRPHLLKVRTSRNETQAMIALTDRTRRVHFMGNDKERAESIATRMVDAMTVVMR